MDALPLGVFVRCPRDHEDFKTSLQAVERFGVHTIHLGAPRSQLGRSMAGRWRKMLTDRGIRVTAVFCGFDGNNYQTRQTARETVGLSPAATRAQRLAETLEMADFAHALGCDVIGMHLGSLPAEMQSLDYQNVAAALRCASDHCAQLGQSIHLETGAESAPMLLEFLRHVGQANIAVNFDPANFILYGTGDPMVALDLLATHVRSVHCKDACRIRVPGQPWHEDCALGSGDVGIERFVRELLRIGYRGPLTIERECSADWETDVAKSIQLLDRLLA